MGMDAKAVLIGRRPADEILAFVKSAVDPDAEGERLTESSHGNPFRGARFVEPYASWIMTTDLVKFSDSLGRKRQAIVIWSSLLDETEASEYGPEAEAGLTYVSVGADREKEGEKFAEAVTKRFGGWLVRNDCSGDRPERFAASEESGPERRAEEFLAWKFAAERLADAVAKYESAASKLSGRTLEAVKSGFVPSYAETKRWLEEGLAEAERRKEERAAD